MSEGGASESVEPFFTPRDNISDANPSKTLADDGAISQDPMRIDREQTDKKEMARVSGKEEAMDMEENDQGCQSKRRMLTELPDACIALIVSFLSPKDIVRGACVCRGFKETLDSDLVWELVLPSSVAVVMGRAVNSPPKFATKKKTYEFLCKPLLLNLECKLGADESTTRGRTSSFGRLPSVPNHSNSLAYWLDQGTGGVCYSMAARGLRIVWGDDERYWSWGNRQGSRWPEVACLEKVCWFYVMGDIKCFLPPGSYTLSWRIHYETRRPGGADDRQYVGEHFHGWGLVPTEFTLALSDGSQATTSHRFLTNRPENATRQNELDDLTPVRVVNDNWMEYDVGEITVVDRERETLLEFAMMETQSGLWKSGVTLDGVVLRPTSLAEVTGRKLTVEELGEKSLESERPPFFDGPRGRLVGRGQFRAMRRGGLRVVHGNPLRDDAGEN